MSVSRRNFLALAGAGVAAASIVSPLDLFYQKVSAGEITSGPGFGPLFPKLPENADELAGLVVGGIDLGTTPILELPKGFNYTAISITGQPMNDGGTVPALHDGMAAFRGSNNTTLLVRNHEVGSNGSNPAVPSNGNMYDQLGGGTTTLVIGADRLVKFQYTSIAGTIRNCAGGPTPWGSWITCEENVSLPGASGGVTKKHGYNFEVPASETINVAEPIPLVAMGRFNHEAVAVEDETGWVFETEDEGDSLLYRFRPNVRGDLRSGGVLEALKITDSRVASLTDPNNGNPITEASTGSVNTVRGVDSLKNVPLEVTWVTIDTPDPVDNATANRTRTQGRVKGAARFSRGEGAWYGNGATYFVCSNGGNDGRGQVFAYKSDRNDPTRGWLTLVVEATWNPDGSDGTVAAPDNICVAPFGDLFLCEDGSGTEFVVGVNTSGELYRFAANVLNGSEFAGACFSPDGKTLFVNMQTPGITFAIWGPWTRKRG
ncbi:MAG TPA: alkaline phosphatase PhoX [Pyrinomonadaceae bacterium]